MLNLVVAFVIGYYCDRLFGVSLFGWPQRWLFRGSSGPFVLAVFFGFVAVGLLALTFPPDLAASHKLPAFWGKLSESRLLLSLSGFFIGSFVSAWLSETDPSQDSKRSDLFYTQRSLVVVGLGIAGLILALDHDYGIMSRVAKVQTSGFTLELAQSLRGADSSDPAIVPPTSFKAPVSSDPTAVAFLLATDISGQMARDETLVREVFAGNSGRKVEDYPEHEFIRTVIDPTVSRLRVMHDRWHNKSLEFIVDPKSVHGIRLALARENPNLDEAILHINAIYYSVADQFRLLCANEPEFMAFHFNKNGKKEVERCPTAPNAQLFLEAEAVQVIGNRHPTRSSLPTLGIAVRDGALEKPQERPFLHIALAGLLNGIGHGNAGVAELHEWMRKAQSRASKDNSPEGAFRLKVWEFRARLAGAMQLDGSSAWPGLTMVARIWSDAADTGMQLLVGSETVAKYLDLFKDKSDFSARNEAECLRVPTMVKRAIYNTYLAKNMSLFYMTADKLAEVKPSHVDRASRMIKDLQAFRWECLKGTGSDYNEVKANIYHTIAGAELHFALKTFDGEWSGDAKKHLCSARSAIEVAAITASCLSEAAPLDNDSYLYVQLDQVDDDKIGDKVGALQKRIQSILKQAPATLCG
ncbi:hypothetical protein [uncultured Alsobacter sp.]|uniref:hypothetical protein n=1 Tax=uncultured Alsobacter sp. TaxID=1748258 RepID=UPI0025E15589|nr:hypothetical protein [uncultured Alsobacter sp.]